MYGMGIGHEIWQVEGIKCVWVWDMDNIKVDILGIGKRSLELAEERKFGGLVKMF
jgi:hypothetical protein